MDCLNRTVEELRVPSYAEVASRKPRPSELTPSHTIIVSSKDQQQTAQQVLEQVQGGVNVRELGIGVQRLRKAKHQKVVVSCTSRKGAEVLGRRITEAYKDLVVEDAARRLPQVIIRDVMAADSDADIIASLKGQNPGIYEGLDPQEGVKVRFRMRTRNPLQCHVVLEATPKLWRRLMSAKRLHIGWLRCRVEEKSPLVQCGKCLAYGHTKAICRADVPAALCSHCATPGHNARDCPKKTAAPPSPPACANCLREKQGSTDHHAFSDACPVRTKWEAIARASVSYC